MCMHINSFATNTKFIILMHPKEFKKVKNNTGRFTHLNLQNSEIFVGINFSNNQRINEIIATHDSYILFPSEDALNLTQEKPSQTQKNLAIFLIDSTWGCVNKMLKQSENLAKLKHMSFTTTHKSIYDIKEQPGSKYLSTIESTLVVLKLLDAYKIENIQKERVEDFLNPFKAMIHYQKDLIQTANAKRFKQRSR
ncbi:MAG: hypothetical protein COB42_06145 [Sulfurimonas sp.]|nr:MAG: hypothetical protein COB42_06145 [Sulfurimonas sp.]